VQTGRLFKVKLGGGASAPSGSRSISSLAMLPSATSACVSCDRLTASATFWATLPARCASRQQHIVKFVGPPGVMLACSSLDDAVPLLTGDPGTTAEAVGKSTQKDWEELKIFKRS
jgi:hypothetical protein